MKTGRTNGYPPTEEKRTCKLGMAMTDEELGELDSICKETGLSRSSIMRLALLLFKEQPRESRMKLVRYYRYM